MLLVLLFNVVVMGMLVDLLLLCWMLDVVVMVVFVVFGYLMFLCMGGVFVGLWDVV